MKITHTQHSIFFKFKKSTKEEELAVKTNSNALTSGKTRKKCTKLEMAGAGKRVSGR